MIIKSRTKEMYIEISLKLDLAIHTYYLEAPAQMYFGELAYEKKKTQTIKTMVQSHLFKGSLAQIFI